MQRSAYRWLAAVAALSLVSAPLAAQQAKLAAFAEAQSVRNVDIGDRLLDSRGLLSEEMAQASADALKPIFVERLGAALDVDVAPAATGNPAAR